MSDEGMEFYRNLGTTDRIVRTILAFAIIATGFLFTGVVSIVLWIAAAILLVNAATGFCGLYATLGIKTYKKCKETQSATRDIEAAKRLRAEANINVQVKDKPMPEPELLAPIKVVRKAKPKKRKVSKGKLSKKKPKK